MMSRSSPTVRKGLIFAGIHQACALLGIALLWIAPPAFFWWCLPLIVADLLSISIAALIGILIRVQNWNLPLPNVLLHQLHVQGQDGLVPQLMVIVLTFGAVQWFLIGFYFSWLERHRWHLK